jgi:polyisoprenoid-binding protein YceI
MRKLFLILLAFGISSTLSAQKFISKDGHIWFYSYTPLEEIEAHNHQVVSILDASTGDLNFSLLMKSFEFKRALMQEHFNENYVESDKFPKATFKGKINNIASVDFKKDGVYQVEVSGDMTIHGVTKNLTTKGSIEIKAGSAIAKSKFVLIPKDFDIKIPSLVENKIAKEITVNVDITYKPSAK